MAHIALYRAWRPQAFHDMVGQQHIIQTLQNALKEGRFSHAYLFSGPRGTGKTSAAKILAKAVNCERGPAEEPCNECPACIRITDGSIMDVVEIDAASNRGVEEIRDIRDKVRFAPTEVRHKVYIIDEVHMLTTEAFNALLKTLEEPPAHVMFILATTEPHRLPATIISRCQRFDFRRIPLQEQVEHLQQVCAQEKMVVEPEALQYIARLSDGGMRDAISLLDQIASYSDNRISYDDVLAITGGVASDQFERLASAIVEKNIGGALEVIDHWMQDGKSADKCLENLMLYFRDLLLIKMVPNSEAVTDRIVDPTPYKTFAERFSHAEIIRIIETLNSYQTEMKYSPQPQTIFEVAVMKICSLSMAESAPAAQLQQPQSLPDQGTVSQLQMKIQRLEEQVAKLIKQAASPPPADSGAKAAPSTPAPRSPAAYRKSGVKLDPFLQNNDQSFLQTVTAKWGQVLSRVKEQKITVHAWLVDGEPTAVHEDTVLLAFKSTMHRETTEKPANKQLIEQVMSEILGRQLKLATVMLKEWEDAQEGKAKAAPEILQPEPEEVPTSGRAAKEEWIHEAIELFGKDLVKIKEDD